MRLSGQFQACLFFFFLQKHFKHTKMQIKPKPTNKTKLSQQKTTKATIFHEQKLLRGGRLFILHFFFCPKSLLKKIETVLITSFTILLNYGV